MLAVETTQWIIAIGSLGSALVALALGLEDWFFRPRVRLVLRHASDPEEISDRIVTKRLETGETAAFVRLRIDDRGRSTARNVAVSVLSARSFVTVAFDGTWSDPESSVIWEHFLVHGPSPEIS